MVVFFLFFIVNIFCLNNVVVSQEILAETKHEQQNNADIVYANDNEKIGFFKKYVYTDENPIFGKKNNIVSVFFGYSWSGIGKVRLYSGLIESHNESFQLNKNLYESYYDMKRHIYHLNISYGRKNKLFNFIHGRFSVGLFAMIGNATAFSGYYEVTKEIVYYRDVGVEAVQEIVFGSPLLYVTGGIGVSYIFPRADKDNSRRVPLLLNSLLNVAIVATVGHRFGDNFVIEFMYKHYSNGGLQSPNFGINQLGVNVGFVF